jgi:large subunit ribosomal protein L13
MSTYFATNETARRDWVVVDAAGQTLGRLATEVARRLRGKHKPEFTPHIDTGDYVVVINAEKIHATGNKFQDKLYWRHTEYPGGIKSTSLQKMIKKAVKGMLPKGPLGYAQFRKLKVYAGGEHPHTAQQPKVLTL